MKRPVIFTDLDGTLLDHETYSFAKALQALSLIRERRIPLVICSSKTRREIEHYRELLVNRHPFVSENGGGLFIPRGYFPFPLPDYGFPVSEENDFIVIRLGASYPELREAMDELRREGFSVRGFGDMTAEEVSALTKLTLAEAEMAKERDFDEAFILEKDCDMDSLRAAIAERGFHYTQGRFHHILGDSDKGKAVSLLTGLYRRWLGEILTIAIGDSPNDIPMLEMVDYPVAVRKPDGSCDQRISVSNLIRADGIGPAGWNKAICELL
ncbi:MAG: HAD-IIB family hydrolase [Thermodesulfovibrionales bacterium]|jgi:mannosyl-3-phosphoglycerate phosphatase